MKQVIRSLKDGAIRVVEVPAPRVSPGTVVVQVEASVISPGTERNAMEFSNKGLLGKARQRPDLVRQVVDKARREGVGSALQTVRSRLDTPLPLGYSGAGRVLEVGDGVDHVQPGQKVACAGGGYAVHAEIVRVPANLVVPVGEHVPLDQAAFATVGSVAMHGMRLADVHVGETVAVLGLGLIGQLAVQLAAAAGAQVVGFDPSDVRSRTAADLGVAVASTGIGVFEQEVRRVSGGAGADAVLVCAATSSNDPIQLAAEVARDRGHVVIVGVVGMEVPRRPYFEKELTLQVARSYGPGRYDAGYEEGGHDYPIGYVRWTEGRNLGAFIGLLEDDRLRVGDLITHRFPIDEASAAYELVTDGDETSMGVVLEYPAVADQTTRQDVVVTGQSEHLAAGNQGLGVGFLGAGSYARDVLLPTITDLEGVSLTGVCASTGASARHTADRFGFNYCTTDPGQVLGDPRTHVVAIATRHDSHADLVERALAAGKHVHCEKPLALTREELAEVVGRAGDARSPVLTVGYNRRFSALTSAMRDFLRETGEPISIDYRVNAGAVPLDHWVHDPAQGGGRVVGEVCHFVDFIGAVLEDLPVEVSAAGLPNAGRYRNDNVHITLRFASGSIGTIRYLANGTRAVGKERVEGFAGGRVAILDDFRRLELMSSRGRKVVKAPRFRQDKGHRAQWTATMRAVRVGEPPIGLDELTATTLATLAVERCVARKCTERIDVRRFLAEARTLM